MKNPPSVVAFTDSMTVQDLERYARRVEELGYDSLWIPELTEDTRLPGCDGSHPGDITGAGRAGAHLACR